jgi:hypothetical protein
MCQIFSNFTTYLKHKYGEDSWDNIRDLGYKPFFVVMGTLAF